MTPFTFDFSLAKTDITYSEKDILPQNKNIQENQNRCPYEIPSLDGIFKKIEQLSGRVDEGKLISDIFACGAIAIANKTDFAQAEKREEKYLKIIRSYTPAEREGIASVFCDIYALLSSVVYSNGRFDDYLGELFMRCNVGNKKAGQFFTPYPVSRMMAQVILDADTVKLKTEVNEILTINDPCCGGGGMILAAMDVLQNYYGVNYARNCFVDCGDIDERCVNMTYLQLSLAGVPAVVRHQNALTRELWGVWYTPAYLFQYLRFRKFADFRG